LLTSIKPTPVAKKNTNREATLRIVAKATSWRFFATCDTIILSLIFTGQIGSALKIGLTEVFTKIGLFYLHERYLWSNLRFGRIYANDNKTVIGDKHYRSIVKGMSWRVFGTMDTILIALFWTGDYKKALAIGATEVITKVGLFWLHERVWFRIKWGQPKDTLEILKAKKAEDVLTVKIIDGSPVEEQKDIHVAI